MCPSNEQGFHSSAMTLLCRAMEEDWGSFGADRINDLPIIEKWPRLSSHDRMVEMFSKMGILQSGPLHDALLRSSRGYHSLPLPSDIGDVNIETSALRMPWWRDVSVHQSLLPGLYETIQVLQSLDIRQGDDVLIIGPRGNWWTEIAMQLGARRIRIVGTVEERLSELRSRWSALRLDQAAEALGCDVEWRMIGSHRDDRPLAGWDRILITGGVSEPPISILETMARGGCSILPVVEDSGTMLQSVRWDDGGFLAQRLAIWNVDLLPEPVVECLCSDGDLPAPHTESPGSGWSVDDAWRAANRDPIRDRLGPLILLQLIQSTWDSLGPGFESSEVESDSRLCIAEDLFRMGHVLQRLGVSDLAAEHHGSSFQMAPSSEAASFLGMTFRESDLDYLAWQRKAIETDPRFGGSWNEIGEAMLNKGDPEFSIQWFRGAINSEKYGERGVAWTNLARAHLELGQMNSALFAAQEASTLIPDDQDLQELLERLSEDLA